MHLGRGVDEAWHLEEEERRRRTEGIWRKTEKRRREKEEKGEVRRERTPEPRVRLILLC
jgi:hypothetical protein